MYVVRMSLITAPRQLALSPRCNKDVEETLFLVNNHKNRILQEGDTVLQRIASIQKNYQ